MARLRQVAMARGLRARRRWSRLYSPRTTRFVGCALRGASYWAPMRNSCSADPTQGVSLPAAAGYARRSATNVRPATFQWSASSASQPAECA